MKDQTPFLLYLKRQRLSKTFYPGVVEGSADPADRKFPAFSQHFAVPEKLTYLTLRYPNMETTWLNTQDADFDARLAALTAHIEERDAEVAERVQGILRDVAKRGDAALVEYTARFDRRDVSAAADLVVGEDQLQAALARIPAEQRQALEARQRHGCAAITKAQYRLLVLLARPMAPCWASR